MVTNIDRAELQRLVDEEEAQVVDVLPAWEYEESHIPAAISIPLKHLDADSTSAMNRDKPLVVY